MASYPIHKRPRIPKSGANLAAGTVCGCIQMPLKQHDNGSNTLCISIMDAGSSLRWMIALNMMYWYHFHSQSNTKSPNLGPTSWSLEWYKGAPICPWYSIPMAQLLSIYLIWMWEAVWIGWQPQTWRNDTFLSIFINIAFKNLLNDYYSLSMLISTASIRQMLILAILFPIILSITFSVCKSQYLIGYVISSNYWDLPIF
jgi:hypothetical protein